MGKTSHHQSGDSEVPPLAAGDVVCIHQFHTRWSGVDPLLQEGEQMWAIAANITTIHRPLLKPDRVPPSGTLWEMDPPYDRYEVVNDPDRWPEEVCVALASRALLSE